MTDNRRPHGAAVPRPRPAGGVMAFVAELQQLDTTPTPPRIVVEFAAAPETADPGSPGRTSADPATVDPAPTGAAPDSLTTDHSAADGSAADGLARDGLAADGLARDGLAADGSAADGLAADGSAADGLARDGLAPVDHAVVAFEGGPAATATATDDATAEFLLGWVREPSPTSPPAFSRGRKAAAPNRRPAVVVPAPMMPAPAMRRPAAIGSRASRLPAALPVATGYGPSSSSATLIHRPRVAAPVPRPVQVRPLRAAAAFDQPGGRPLHPAIAHGFTPVAPSRPAGRRHRWQSAMLSLAGVAVAVAGGVAYAAHDPAPTRTIVLPPPLQVPTPAPGTGSGHPAGAVPGVQPIPSSWTGAGSSAGPSSVTGRALPGTVTQPGSVSPGSVGAGPGATGPGAGGPGSGRPGSSGPGGPGSGGPGSGGPGSGGPGSGGPGSGGPGSGDPGSGPANPGTTAPGRPVPPTEPLATRSTGAPPPTRPVPVPPAPPPVPAAPLSATFSRTADVGPLGLTGYVGTVRIANPGGVDVTGWRVRITVPGGNEVSGADGAVVKQDGKRVVFTPTAATRTVPAGGSVTFSFTVYGVLAGEPTDCAIDGRPCY